MKSLAKITLFGALAALGYGCSTDAPTALTAEMTSDDAPAYGPWSAPVNLGPVVNSPYNDNHPAISKDGLSLYISSDRPGGRGGSDIWVSQRASIDDPWGAPVLVPELSSPFRDTRTTIRRDGLEMIMSTGRPGGVGSEDLWVSTRASTLDPWSAPVNLGAVVNSTAFDGAPALSFDGTTLYFFSERAGGFRKLGLYLSTPLTLQW